MTEQSTNADITLPERCSVTTAQELFTAGTALPAGGRLLVDAATVTRMSCATIVALISVTQAIAPTDGKVVIQSPSGAFTDAFSDLGVFESLMKMEFAE